MNAGVKSIIQYTERGIILPTGSEEMGILGVGSIRVAILPSCQDMKTTAIQCRESNIVR